MLMWEGFSLGFLLFSVVFLVIAAAIFTLIVMMIVKTAQQRSEQAAAPEASAAGAVVAKRVETHGGGESPVRQQHYVTFEQPGGARFELEAPPAVYGLLVEGDRGTIVMKGTHLLAFQREVMR